MIRIDLCCYHCQSDNIVSVTTKRNIKQGESEKVYLNKCLDCGKYTEHRMAAIGERRVKNEN